MSLSTASRLGSQNNSERPSSSKTSTAACSDCPQHAWIDPYIPLNWLFQCPSRTRTNVPLRASYASKSLPLFSWSGPKQLRYPRSPYHARPSQQHTPELPSSKRCTVRVALRRLQFVVPV